MSRSDQRPKITVEDLLRLKRTERPDAEFWTNFERELRQKQLTALLAKRAWWQDLPQFFARRVYLPIGATAVLAFSLVSIKYYAPGQPAQVEVAPATGPVVTTARHLEPSPVSTSVPVSSPLVNRSESFAADEESGALADATPAVAVDTTDLPRALIAPPKADSPSARSIAANLERLKQSEPELLDAVMGNRLSAPARVQNVAATSVELESVSVGTSRRSRLLARFDDRQLAPTPAAPALVRERLARRLGDPEITDRLSRIGLKGDEVSLGLTLRL